MRALRIRSGLGLGREGFVRKFLFGVAMSVIIGGVAYAEDFIVVRSSDPRIPKNTTYSSGERVYLAKGATMTIINGAGTLATYTGRTGGIVLPSNQPTAADQNRFAGLLALLQGPQARRTFGAMRGGGRFAEDDPTCPKADSLTSVDAILQADQDGCTHAAQTAMAALTAPKPQ